MPAPTNPKKRSLMPSGSLRKSLRAAGHHLSSIVQVGKEGVTAPVLRQLVQALHDHELVKVKVGSETPEDRFETCELLAKGAEAQVAQILGRTLLLYRRHPEKPRFEPLPPGSPPPSRPAARPKVAPKPKRSAARSSSARRPAETRRKSPRRSPRRA